MTTNDFQSRLLDAMPAILWSACASTYRFTYVSAAAETMLGYAIQRWIDEPEFWKSILHPDDQDIPARCHEETVAGRDHELVYRMIAADGRVVWLRDSVRLRIVDGLATELYGVMIDITREREAELELSESHENFKRMVDHSPDCIAVHIDGVFAYVNDAFVRLLGASSDGDIIGRVGTSFAHPEFHAAIRDRSAELQAGRPVPYMRQRFLRVDGQPLDVEVAAIPVLFDGQHAVQLIVRDLGEQLRSEEALRARELRLQTLAAGTNEAIWEWDVEAGEIWTNDAHRRLFGESVSADSIFDHWISRVHPDDQEVVRARGGAAVRGDVPQWSHEYRFRQPDGTYRVLLDRGFNLTPETGMRRLLGAILDITPLRQAEQAGANAQAKFQWMVEQSVVGVYTRSGSRLTYINQTGADMLGYEVDELLAMADATTIMVPEDRETFDRSGELPPTLRATHRDGREIYISLFETPVELDGEPDVHIGTFLNVTGQYAAERDLVDSERRYRELVESVGEILYTVDSEGNFVSLSRSFERISGYAISEWIGKSFIGLFEPASVPLVIDHFERSMAGDTGIIRQYEIRAKSGEVLTIEVTSQPRVQNGAVTGTVGVARDVTKMRHAERKLDEARRLASLGQLAASLAHEFNNVLMGIQPFVEVIARSTPPTPRLTDSIDHIKRAISRGKRASQEILRFANPQSARITDVDAATWLPTVVNSLRPTLPEGIAIRCSIASSVRALKADREQLDQVITNLVFNARDAMPGGGTIDITLARLQPEAAIGTASRFVRIRVSDDGPGIPPELHGRVFEPLFTTKRNGTGLGLSIARRLVEAIGGSLHLVPAERGTCIDILLPEGEVAAVQSAPAAIPASSVRRVLLVEDDDAVGEGLRELLELEGFETTWVRDIASAIVESERSRPDVAIVDVNLADGSGVRLIPILRARYEHLPVVLSTGHVEFNLDACDRRTVALLKPYEIGDLLGAIGSVSN